MSMETQQIFLVHQYNNTHENERGDGRGGEGWESCATPSCLKSMYKAELTRTNQTLNMLWIVNI